jgi:two-component system response regulator HydG
MITESLHRPDPFEPFVTRDPLVLHSVARLRSWSQQPLGVLLTGEAGVGKSLLARLLHLASHADGAAAFIRCVPGLPVNPAHPWATLETDGGTVVLDGLEHWPLEAQEEVVQRIAACSGAPVRVIATSRLPEDRLWLESRLHPRLARCWHDRVIHVPPLRSRPDDLAPLVQGMLRRAGRGSVELEAGTWRALVGHGWTDNVRELRRTIDGALSLVVGDRLEPRHLPLDRLVPPALESLAGMPFEAMRREVDCWYLRRLLHETGENLSEAARRSGCTRKVLRERLRRYGLYRKARKLAVPGVLAPSFAQDAGRRAAAARVEAAERRTAILAAEERVIPWSVVERARARRLGRAA